MDSMMIQICCILLAVIFCQHGMSYRIYILPEPGAFCLGVFSGDTCLTWSEYSANPTFVDHSTTLIFTPGSYQLQHHFLSFSVANIKHFTMIGDGARILFRLSFSNIGYVGLHNLTLANDPRGSNSPRIGIRNIRLYVMENCTFSLSSNFGSTVGLHISNTNSKVIESTFNGTSIDAYCTQSSPTLLVSRSTFINSSCVIGSSSCRMTIHSSRFVNNHHRDGVIYTQGLLIIVNCLFDRNSAPNGGTVYSNGDVTVMSSNFTSNEARGGSAISGLHNINVSDCTFSFYTQSDSVVHSRRYNSYYSYRQRDYIIYITNSVFYHNNRTIYSNNDVIVKNSSFYNSMASSGDGGAVYSTKSVTTVNCTFINSTAIHGNGGAVYSGENMTVLNSTFITSSAGSRGGTLYSQQAISVFDCNINDSIAGYDGGAVFSTQNMIAVNSMFSNSTASDGNGGAIYSGNDVMTINCTVNKCSALRGKGGAVYSTGAMEFTFSLSSTPDVVFSRSFFSHNSASGCGVLYVNGHYAHRMEFTNSTFVFNEAMPSDQSFTGGGVACIRNTSLVIVNSVFNNNMAASNGGVLDVSFSSVRIELSSVSHNTARGNGGAFYVREYTTNFTIAHTVFENNAAENGGVMYVRRSNSNINLVDSTFIENSATNQGGVMDIRGVTFMMDMDTVIANKTANVSGNVISACLCQITAYGLEVQPDPIYPTYCSNYDERNRSESVSTDISTSSSLVTEHTGTPSQPVDQEDTYTRNSGTDVDVVTSTEGDTTTSHSSEGTAVSHSNEMSSTTPQQPFAMTVTSGNIRGNTVASEVHTSEGTTNSADSGTVTPQPWSNGLTTFSGRATMQNYPRTSQTVATTQSRTDGLTTSSEEVTSAAVHGNTVAADTTTMTDSAASTDDDRGTTKSMNHTGTITARPQNETETPTPSVLSSESTAVETTTKIINSPDDDDDKFTPRFHQTQADQEEYDMWNSQQELVQVAVISLAVLCIVCISVFIMTAILFFMACKRRNIQARGHYKEVPLKDDKEAHDDGTQEYSFVEIQPHHAMSALSQQDEK